MKILFVENRYKTGLWELIGQMYQEAGHEIHWIVQNHQFMPSFGHKHVLPFPKGKVVDKENLKSKALQKIIESNRGLNYFEVPSDDFIYHYDAKIEAIIKGVQPDLVIGEATAFHELLVSKSCKQHGILFLNPSSCRYPSRRFSFYEYDSLIPFKGSGEEFSEQKAVEFIDQITKRSVKPDYMNKIKSKVSRLDQINDKLKLIRGYYQGEKFNTPSLFVKRKLGKINAERIEKWEELAVDHSTIPGTFRILYPLQMQPEANIDVWGHPHRNQTTIIQEIAANLKGHEVLVLKPNPKSKYEIDDEILKLLNDPNSQVYAMHHKSKMEDIWNNTDLVVTVTGTVSMECVFANKPVAMLGDGMQTAEKNCSLLKDLSTLRSTIDAVALKNFPQLTREEKITYLNKLVATSYQGVIADAFHSKDELENTENKEQLLKAFQNILIQIEPIL